jgi:ribonuclease HI
MLIAIDGACKRNGTPECMSCGVAWIQTEKGDMLFVANVEATGSTNQRGEINGLLEALKYAVQHAGPDEDIVIITDSEYLHNTVMLEWYIKWHHNNWHGATGPVKNADLWSEVYDLLFKLNNPVERVFMQWTKGHLIHYTPGNTKKAMVADPSGVELHMRISSIANRESERGRIISDFTRQRLEHDRVEVDKDTALAWVIANTVADCLASFIVKTLNEQGKVR